MATTTVLDNEFATVWFYEDTKIIHHVIKKWVSGENLRNILNSGYEVIRDKKGTKWLSDDRLNNALRLDDAEWARTDWFPRMVTAGWKSWAVVLPEKIIGQMNMKAFAEEYKKGGVTANLFSDPAVALKWLEDQ